MASLAFALLAPAARAMPMSVMGGQVLSPGVTVASVGFGFPALRAAYVQGITESLDLGTRVAYDYMLGEGELAASARWALGSFGPGALALRALLGGYGSLGLTFWDPKNTDDAGLLFGAGATWSFDVQEAALLAVSLDAPMAWTFGRGGGVIVPLLLGGAIDLALDEKVNLGGSLQVGPRWDAPGERITRVRLWIEGHLWTTVRMF